MSNAPSHIMPNGHIVYQTDSAWDYFRVQAMDEQRRRWRRGDWVTYDYNATHHVKQHSITNEFVFKPIPILTKPHNETHYAEINQIQQTTTYRPYHAPSSYDFLFFPFLAILLLLVYVFTQEPTQKKKSRCGMN